MRTPKLTTIILLSAIATAVAADTGPLPRDIIKPQRDGTVPTAVWLAECEVFFNDFLKVRQEIDETVAAGGFDDEPQRLSDALNRGTVPAAREVLNFCTAYVPDTKWGLQLRQELIDAMVSSLASDASVVDVISGQKEHHIPLANIVREQKEVSDRLIEEVHERILNAPTKFRLPAEKLNPSRNYYFQSLSPHHPLVP